MDRRDVKFDYQDAKMDRRFIAIMSLGNLPKDLVDALCTGPEAPKAAAQGAAALVASSKK